MDFEEALRLARLIHERDGWYLLDIEPASGEELEANHWSVSAVCALNWRYFHYWNRSGSAGEWLQYADAFENGSRHRASSHEV